LRATLAGPVLLALLVVGCGSTPPRSSTTEPDATTATSPTASALLTAPPSAAGSPVSTAVSSGSALVDPSLLDVIPASAGGLTLTFDPETTGTEASDPTLDPNVAAIATGLATAPGGSDASELVIVNVVRLRNPAVDEEWFREWRDSYDTAACERAGGVSGHASSTINGHAVFIGSCQGGAFTYHLRIANGSVVVSLTSVGPSRPGERVVEAIPAD
jgi:hypothetical protein